MMMDLFTSPCEVWVVSGDHEDTALEGVVYVPLRGVDCFGKGGCKIRLPDGFRPLAEYGLFHQRHEPIPGACTVIVPLRGVDCFKETDTWKTKSYGYRPLAGCGLFQQLKAKAESNIYALSSPCGVWIVSAKVHSPSSCSAGKPSLFANYNTVSTFLQGELPVQPSKKSRRSGAKLTKRGAQAPRFQPLSAQGSSF